MLVAGTPTRSYRAALINQRPYAMRLHEHRHRQQISEHFTLASDRPSEMGSGGGSVEDCRTGLSVCDTLGVKCYAWVTELLRYCYN